MSVTRDTSSFQAAQKSGETIDQYVTVLRKLSETCGFSTLKNSLIKDRIVLGICDTKTTERLLISDLTLEKAIDKVRSAEATEIQQRDMANDPAVHGIGVAKKKPPFRKEPPANEFRPSSSKIFHYRNRGMVTWCKRMPNIWQDMSQLQETALFPEHMLVTKRRPWTNGRQRRGE